MDLVEFLEAAVGWEEESHDLTAMQMIIRAVLVYGAGLAIVRFGSRRFMARTSPFDLIVAIMIGSIFARAVTGNSPIIPALAACAALIAIHWLLAALAVRCDPFAILIKGREVPLVRDGEIQWNEMRRFKVGERDLMEALRLHGKTVEVDDVKLAMLERNGDISIIFFDDRERNKK